MIVYFKVYIVKSCQCFLIFLFLPLNNYFQIIIHNIVYIIFFLIAYYLFILFNPFLNLKYLHFISLINKLVLPMKKWNFQKLNNLDLLLYCNHYHILNFYQTVLLFISKSGFNLAKSIYCDNKYYSIL
jgi:hypothetical protein